MGFLALRDTGKQIMNISGNLFEFEVDSPEGIYNPSPTAGDGFINARGFSLALNSGKEINKEPNISGNKMRYSLNAQKPASFSLNAKFSIKVDGDDSAQPTATQIQNNLGYLYQWSRSKSIVMMFISPTTGNSTNMYYGQPGDFYQSILKIIYDTLWDRNSNASNKGFNGSLYGTYHYRLDLGGTLANTDLCAVPCLIEDVNISQSADSKIMNVTATGVFLENEQ